MNEADVFVLLLLAFADVALFAYLRARRRRREGTERVIMSLRLHLRHGRAQGTWGTSPVSLRAH